MKDKLKIIVADDHPLLMQGLIYILQKNESFSIIGQALNGREALNLIRELKPDIAILDVQMPKMDGFEVTKLVMKEKLATKIIFLTMFKDEEFIKTYFKDRFNIDIEIPRGIDWNDEKDIQYRNRLETDRKERIVRYSHPVCLFHPERQIGRNW